MLNDITVKGINSTSVENQMNNFPSKITNSKTYNIKNNKYEWILTHINSIGSIILNQSDMAEKSFDNLEVLAEPDLFNSTESIVGLPYINDNLIFYQNLFYHFNWSTAWELIYSFIGNGEFMTIDDLLEP